MCNWNFIATVKTSEKLTYYWFNFNILQLLSLAFTPVRIEHNIKTKTFSHCTHVINYCYFNFFLYAKVNRSGKEKKYYFQKRCMVGLCVYSLLVKNSATENENTASSACTRYISFTFKRKLFRSHHYNTHTFMKHKGNKYVGCRLDK